MKKLIVAIAALVLAFTCVVSVTAAEEFATAGDLYQYWAENSMPDYVCGVWSTDGSMTNLTIAVQDNEAGNAGKQEILDLIADDSTVTFTYQQYSRNYMLKVQEEIFPYFEKDLGLISTGVDEYQNRIVLGIHEDRINEKATQEMLSELNEKYGDIFVIEQSSGIYLTVEDTLENFGKEKSSDNKYQIPIICALILFAAAGTGMIIFRKRRIKLLQTDTGETAVSAPLSTKEIENMVKKSNAKITSELDSKIMREIEKNKEKPQ